MTIYKKLAEVKKALDGKVVKNSTANMGKFKYSFINLERLLDLVEPELEARGLYLYFPCMHDAQGCYIVDTEASDEDEDSVMSQCAMQISKDFQETGKQMTYLRRYLLLGLLGLQASEDDDGAKSRGGEVTRKKDTPKKPTSTSHLVSGAKGIKDKEQFKIFLHAKAEELRTLGSADKTAFKKVLSEKCKEFGLKESQAIDIIKGAK